MHKQLTDKDCLLAAERALRAHNELRPASLAERDVIVTAYRSRADAWAAVDEGTWFETADALQARVDFYRERVAKSANS